MCDTPMNQLIFEQVKILTQHFFSDVNVSSPFNVFDHHSENLWISLKEDSVFMNLSTHPVAVLES